MVNSFLLNFGISEVKQQQYPTSADMPPVFNKDYSYLWKAAIKNVNLESNSNIAWGIAIRRFVNLCIRKNLHPFLNDPSKVNEYIVKTTRQQYKTIASFFQSNLADDTIGFYNTTLNPIVTINIFGSGFTIRCIDNFSANSERYFNVLDKLIKAGLKELIPRKYRLNFDNGAYLIAYYNHECSQYYLEYVISCSKLPYFSDICCISNAEYEEYIKTLIYFPIIRLENPTRLLS